MVGSRTRAVWGRITLAAVIGFTLLAAAGCGSTDPGIAAADPGTGRVLTASTCTRQPLVADAQTVIVLDWNGGPNPLVPDHDLDAFDFAALALTSADNAAAADEAAFRQAVEDRVRLMLCVLEPLDVAVITADQSAYPGQTIVHITADAPFTGLAVTGQSDFDPCNEHNDDVAIVWAGALTARVSEATFEQWVNAIANVATHEIGHTLGFFHPSEETIARTLPLPAAEVMRATARVSDLLQEKAFLIEQNTCPVDESGEMSYHLDVIE